MIVRVDQVLPAGLAISFRLSNLQLPGFATQDETTGVAKDLGTCRVTPNPTPNPTTLNPMPHEPRKFLALDPCAHVPAANHTPSIPNPKP